jgi:3-hydroxyacyl-[acyl-carrier-protein] dehydratase
MNAPPAATVHSPLEIRADHPSFAGHFPKFPVLPGAVLLDLALQAIAGSRGIDLRDWCIASVKFLDSVRPGDPLRLEHAAPRSGVIRFSVHAASRLAASGSLSRTAPLDGPTPGDGA